MGGQICALIDNLFGRAKRNKEKGHLRMAFFFSYRPPALKPAGHPTRSEVRKVRAFLYHS